MIKIKLQVTFFFLVGMFGTHQYCKSQSVVVAGGSNEYFEVVRDSFFVPEHYSTIGSSYSTSYLHSITYTSHSSSTFLIPAGYFYTYKYYHYKMSKRTSTWYKWAYYTSDDSKKFLYKANKRLSRHFNKKYASLNDMFNPQ